ncbi:aminotransferase class I/II-fold pyridoxal phosphate-dependent enzyme [Bacillus spongiae]|uniref:Aminotransferase class I/II-fold pyridoxal phosphate-dependent enzyme n=1 Tax=Bacillus spongiae TaxID=2683610 RepID=A0ABU8HKE2_9BACI
MNQKLTPLYTALKNHVRKKSYSFHVPGHKNGEVGWNNEAFRSFLPYDVTELSGLDDLHAPEDVIKNAESLLSDYYKTSESYFLVGGSTVGNLAMILATCNENDTVFVQRNCHKSVLNGLKLANVNPIFLDPEWDEHTQSPGGVSVSTLKNALSTYDGVKACIFTYPTYYGVTYSLESLIEVAHEKNIVVLVDEAHGPHLRSECLPLLSAIQLGADIVVHSAHKILPAMTMGSFLHINSDRVSVEAVKTYLSVLQSSSPSYPIMASLDIARKFIASFKEVDWRYTMEERQAFLEVLQSMEGMEVIECNDPIKLLLRPINTTGYALQKALEQFNIFPELADPYQVLLMVPLLRHTEESYLRKAAEVLKNLPAINVPHAVGRTSSTNADKIKALSISYREAKVRRKTLVNLENTAGKVSAEMVIPYPPGIPLFMEGETISEAALQQLRLLIKQGAHFQGNHKLEHGKLYVYD